MSKLEQLIAELCPHGVEWKKLGDIATDIYRGTGITKEQTRESGTPCVRYGEIYTKYGIWFKSCNSFTEESLLTSHKYFEHGDILFAITGEKIEEIAKSTVYIGNYKCLTGGDIVVLKHKQNPKYMSYALSTLSAQQQKSKGKVKSKVVHSSVPAIKEIQIPLPPLAIQEEIVKILDNFTELTAELTAELSARKKQYEYYENELLFNKPYVNTLLKDVCSVSQGLQIPISKRKKIKSENCYFYITVQFLKGSDEAYYIENPPSQVICYKNDILVTRTGSTGKIITGVEGCFHNNFFKISKFDNISSRYLYYVLRSNNMYKKMLRAASGGTVPDLPHSKFYKLSIPLPSLAEQERIVAILDRFDALCNDIRQGLPAEIEARKKQYEYYRDKLLSFKEL